jgi:16S rRNA (guanine527-N7)-methyltransferase
MSDIIFSYFPYLSDLQKNRLSQLKNIYDRWNSLINVISRKDMDNFIVHHVLHSLAIGKFITFLPSTRILDVGTGGGFPGIPLAILFPDSEFTLLDSIEKKIKVVSAVAGELDLKNVIPIRNRIENEKNKYHFVISRAVTDFCRFVKMTSKNIDKSGTNNPRNGILYLKGGDLSQELSQLGNRLTAVSINSFFDEPYFDTKKILYMPF